MPNALSQFDYNNAFRGSTSLITGGAGFIGSHLARRLLALGSKVRILDDLTTGHTRNIPQGAEFRQASILDKSELKSAITGCRYVFHEAAMVSVPLSVEHPGRCMEINVGGTENILSAAKEAGVQRVLFAASAAAYGNNPKLPSKEEDMPDCWSPYAASKVTGEFLLSTFARCYNLSTVSLRYFNVFGPWQDPKGAYAAVISAFADALMSGRTPKVFGDGEQTRDFVYIDNIVHANLLAAASDKRLTGEVLNIGCGGRIRLLDVLDSMNRALGKSVKPEFHPARAGDVRHSSADIRRAKEVIGYEPIVGFDEGIKGLLEWAKSGA